MMESIFHDTPVYKEKHEEKNAFDEGCHLLSEGYENLKMTN